MRLAMLPTLMLLLAHLWIFLKPLILNALSLIWWTEMAHKFKLYGQKWQQAKALI